MKILKRDTIHRGPLLAKAARGMPAEGARSARSSVDPIGEAGHTFLFRTGIAAIDRSIVFETVADYAAIAMGASRGKCMDSAFEAVEGVFLTTHDHLKSLVVVISANFANSHRSHSFALCAPARCRGA
jgi:hypothetical protein